MPLDDDELEALLRRADPAVTPEDAPLTSAQLAMRDRIMSGARRPRRRRRPLLWLGIALPAVAAAMVALIVVLNVVNAPRAAALTPRPLAFTSTGASAADVLADAKAALAAGSVAEPERQATSTGWYLHLDEHNRVTSAAISPEITTFDWNADLSGRVTVVAGTPYWANGSSDPIPTKDAPKAGTVLSDMTFPAGTFAVPTADPPGTTVAGMTTWLTAMGLPGDADAADLIDTISTAMSSWTLTDQQHALLLQLLLERDDIHVLGTATDRAGRPVVGVAADSTRFPGVRKLLLISADTGRIVGVESVRTTRQYGLPAGSVIAYTLWELPR